MGDSSPLREGGAESLRWRRDVFPMTWVRPDDSVDLDSDIAFAVWLRALDPLHVIRDLIPAMTDDELARYEYLRRRLQPGKTRSRQDPL